MNENRPSHWRKISAIAGGLGAAAGFAAFCRWQNSSLSVTTYRCGSHKLPSSFEDFVLLQVSDLHNKSFGRHQHGLLDRLAAEEPNAILITGDLVDCHRTNIARAMEFVRGAVRLAPVYYTPGNHEGRLAVYPCLREELVKAGVRVLEDQKACLAYRGGFIELIGLRDPRFLPPEERKNSQVLEKKLAQLTEGDEKVFRLLLSHRPELFPIYQKSGVDMVLCGHAHGGQFRLLHQGVFAPGQGVLPKYTGGVHVQGATAMVVSRGLGNSEFPLRLNNRPEIVKLILSHEE